MPGSSTPDVLRVRFFQAGEETAWDAFVARCFNSTFLHTRRFLGYHRDRFQDRSVLVTDGQELVGALPLAIDPRASDVVVSHPGLSFGGLLHGRELYGQRVLDAFQATTRLLAQQGFKELRYRPVPAFYHRTPAMDDLYALFRIGAKRIRTELSATVFLDGDRHRRKGRKSSLSRAKREGVTVLTGREHLSALWALLEQRLAERHRARPTHRLAEITELAELFPREIQVLVAVQGDDLLGGLVLFNHRHVVHMQYLVANDQGFALGATDMLMAHAIAMAENLKVRAFDLGTSCEDAGHVLNDKLHSFKVGFGAGGYAFDEWSVPLKG